MKFAFCNELFEDWAWSDVCEAAKNFGYDGIEVAPYTFKDDVRQISSHERASIARSAREYGLEVVGTHWLLVKPLGMSLFSPDADVRTFTADYLLSQVDFCADIGGKVMTFGSPAQRSIPAGYDRKKAEDAFIGVLRRVGERAVKRGVLFCVEPLPSSMTNMMETAAEAARIAEMVASPGVSFMLDVKSMCGETDDPAAIIMKYAGRFGHFHANDANLKGPGFGHVDFKPIMKALKEGGYEGYVSVEVFDFKPDPLTIAGKSIEYMQECMP